MNDRKAKEFWCHDTTISIDTESYELARELRDALRCHLEVRKFRLRQDLNVSKLIREDYLIGKRKDLHCRIEAHRIVHVEFWQELMKENRHGGRYDFGKLGKMPKMIRWFFQIEQGHLKRRLQELGWVERPVQPRNEVEGALAVVRHQIATSGHTPPGVDPLGDWDCYDNHQRVDRDGKRIRGGEMKCWYDFRGKLQQGRAYRSLNSMWYFVYGPHSWTQVSSRELFDFDRARDSRKRTTREQLSRLLGSAVREMDFEKAIHLRDKMQAMAEVRR